MSKPIKSAREANERERVAKLIPKPTPKQSLFAKSYALTMNGTQSAKASYNSKEANTLSSIATENLRKPAVQEAIKDNLRRVGFNEHFISDRLKAITEAGTSDKALKQASVRDANKSLELGARLYGLLNNNSTNNTLIVKADLSAKTPNELRDELLRLREEEEKYLND